MDLFELTRKLIDIPSVTGDEKGVGAFLKSHLEGLGYTVELQEVEPERFNVIATCGQPPRIILSTHMDTVPPHIASSEDEQRIFGRGACDAKGIIAAQIMAAQRLLSDGVREIGLLFTVDEEMGSRGAQVANSEKPAWEAEYLINGEPTDNMLAIATKGSLRLTIRTSGRAAHSAFPEQGESAVEKLLDILQDIRNCDWPTDDLLGETTCNIGVVNGGTRPNVIPAEAFADLQLRLVEGVDSAKQILEGAIAGRGEVEYHSAHDPVELLKVDGFDQTVVRFTTDIPYLSSWGKPLLLGPGSILNAHTDHESVGKQELEHAVDLYVRLVYALVATTSEQKLGEAEGAHR